MTVHRVLVITTIVNVIIINVLLFSISFITNNMTIDHDLLRVLLTAIMIMMIMMERPKSFDICTFAAVKASGA